jgi:hypothetical protein
MLNLSMEFVFCSCSSLLHFWQEEWTDDDHELMDDEAFKELSEEERARKLKKRAERSDNPKKGIARADVKHGPQAAHDHHHVRNSILPGVFFIYEIYPFAVEVSETSVPLTHLLIRIMATIGGVFTIVKWADALWFKFVGSKTHGRRHSSSMLLHAS